MKFDDVIQILATSTRGEWISDDKSGSFTYKSDLNLHIERADDERDFKESWATSHSDPNAVAVEFVVKYSSSFVTRQTLVIVDGYRATLPMPKSMDVLEVSASKVNFARIVDSGVGSNVDDYLERSNIQIVAD
ncbi:hypothetical protein [Shewanella baltica]|uniref:hypothetical protein n=1 Tax=Shewanella baltica TaxID=62322 RepID=UPI00217E17D3|nr:hypothetical protein [Shewanella baltica]MCS6206803.1 hypothetical protein [Shewanella baltica]